MNKALAEIIAGMIPHKMTRNRWRGILRYGLYKSLKAKAEVKKADTSPECYLAVCAIAKNEGSYFKEWIEWHLSQGVDKFYIYDNESTDGTREILEPYIKKGIVDYKYWPGYRRQIAAYDDCMRANRLSAHWIAFIDLDEFIVPVKDSSISAFLQRMEDFSAVEINWLIYGSNGEKTRRAGSMMQRFTRHSLPQHELNRHVKTIVNPRKVYNMTGCHECAKMCGHVADSHGNRVRVNFKEREPQHDVIKINHYAVRSLEEFTEKQARGRASGTQRSISMDYFNKYDLNDIAE